MRAYAASFGRCRSLTVFLGLLGALLLPANQAVADEPPEDTPPAIAGGSVSPANLPYQGGNVQIQAEVTDDVGLQNVSVTIYGSDGSFQAFQLFEGYKDNYFGTFEVPENLSDSPTSYEVEVQAYDTNNAYAASTIGGVQVEGRPQFDEAPYVSLTEMFPSVLPAEGGPVTIRAEAGDNRGLSAIFALVTGPNGASFEVPMNAFDFSHFEGTFNAPANSGPLAAEYTVEVVAQDDIGQEGRGLAGTVTVEAPPRPPSIGQLNLRPASRSFGTVYVGRKTTRRIVVSNLPRRGGEPVEATASITGSPAFSIPGAPAGGIQFTLAPGEKRTFLVAFHPGSAGPKSGHLQIARDDGAQPGLAVDLSGAGRAAKRKPKK